MDKYTKRTVTQEEIASDVEKIKAFAEANGFEYVVSKRGVHGFIVPIKYGMMMNYDQHAWEAYVQNVKYTFTYTNWDEPISLRKVWSGYETVKGSHYKNHNLAKDEADLKVFIDNINTGKYTNKVHFLKQNLMKRFVNIEGALEHALMNANKEKLKNKG